MRLQTLLPSPVKEKVTTRNRLDFIREKYLSTTGILFGPANDPVEMNRKALISYFVVVATLTLVQIMRRPDAITNPQFFAEDGQIFFIDRFLNGPVQSIFIGVNGFPYLLQRLVAEVAVPFGVANAPLVYILLTIAINSAATAFFCLPHFRHIIRNDFLRIVFCLVLVSLPDTDPLVNEFSHISWWLAIWSVLICLMQLPRTRWGLVLLGFAYFIVVFTAPVALLTAPIWFVRLVRAGLVRNYRELALCVAIIGYIAAIFILTGNLGARENSHPGPLAAINLYSTRVITTATLGFRTMFNLVASGNGPLAYPLTLLVVLGLSVLVLRYKVLPLLLFIFYCTFSSITLLLLGRAGWGTAWADLNPAMIYDYLGSGPRYFVIGTSLTYLAFFVALDRLQFWAVIPRLASPADLRNLKFNSLYNGPISRAGLKLLVSLTLGLVICNAVAQTFFVPAYLDLNWQKYAAQIQNRLDTGNHLPIVVPLNPEPQYWYFVVANTSFSKEVKVSPDSVLGNIYGDGEVSQSFLSKCDDLSVIRLTLATYDMEISYPVIFRLRDADTQQVLVEQTVPGKDIRNNLQRGFYFAPIAGSLGRKYIFYISMPGSLPGKGIGVLSSNFDSYSGGEAFLNGISTRRDIAFDYGCEKK